MGELTPDSGTILTPSQYRIESLQQNLKFTKESVLEECRLGLPEDQKNDDYRIEKVLLGLGIPLEKQSDKPGTFSGGFQIRIMLAKVLLSSPDLLLLDEPNNYLDIVSIKWLKQYLRSFQGEVLLISHDREFMDSVIQSTMGLFHRQLKKISGKTQKYYDFLLEQEEIHEKTRVNQVREIKKMEEFVDKFRAKARRASQAQSRVKKLEGMQRLEKWTKASHINFDFSYNAIEARNLLEIKNLKFRYPESDFIIKNFSALLKRGDRVGLIGANGKGKTTLLKLIHQQLVPTKGVVSLHPQASMGYFGQSHLNYLNESATVYEEIQSADPKMSPQRSRNLAGLMMFSGDDAKKLIGQLSGGEKARVLLAKVLATRCNVLLLDEPTNHLDQESVVALENGLKHFPGGILVVSHSEGFLRRACNRIWALTDDGPVVCEGDYRYFLSKYSLSSSKSSSEENTSSPAEVENSGLSKKEKAQKKQDLLRERSAATKELKKNFDHLNLILFSAEEKKEQLTQEIIEATSEKDSSLLQELQKKYSEQEKLAEKTLEEVVEIEDKLAKIEARYSKKLSV